ncbi:DUF6634 family protein [Agrobacterium rosae]|uniref:DUF6634 family protein n=1 Tax=Agrobacterium rosae TaxID=1972867 RepID=UPI002A103236|nr:DUF6634 family protein [Agrobacterium rosae]MDX8317100.1 hypothetical protein [Agrobacterium rosae]
MDNEPSKDASLNQASFEKELSAAPLLQGWVLADNGYEWMHGWFFGHPEVDEGTHGHTSRIVAIDAAIPPRWGRTESRLYRLGDSYLPAEREIRYWAQKHSDLPAVVGKPVGGRDDIESLVAYLRSTGRMRAAKVDRLERAYFDERHHTETLTDLRVLRIAPKTS